jgi:hypothetical protein
MPCSVEVASGKGKEEGGKGFNCTAEVYNQAGCRTGTAVIFSLLSTNYMEGWRCMPMMYIAMGP